MQMCVQNVVQPRLDTLTDRLANLVASAQSELRDLERLVERSEARLEGRIATLESRNAVLADGCARAEQRERDLNARIAGIAGDLLRTEPEKAGMMEELERRVREMLVRLDEAEEHSRRSTKHLRKLDERVEEEELRLKKQTQVTAWLEEEMRSKRDARPATALESRVVVLEDKLDVVVKAFAPEHLERQLVMLQTHAEEQRQEVQAATEQFQDLKRELQEHAELFQTREEHELDLRPVVETQETLTARVDDLNLRTGVFKVKMDGLEGRLEANVERTEAVRKPLEECFQQQLADRCGKLSGELLSRIEIVERRIDSAQESCDDAVDALARHAARERPDTWDSVQNMMPSWHRASVARPSEEHQDRSWSGRAHGKD